MRSFKFAFLTGFAALAMLPAASAYAAPTVGDALTCAQTGPNSGFTCSSATATVGAGVEFTGGFPGENPFLSFDFSSAGLTVGVLAPNTLGSTIYRFADLTTPFSTFSLLSQNGFAGYNAANTSLTNGAFSLDLRGTTNAVGDRLVFSFNSAVPEPATWAMMIAGFGAIGFAMRRRRQVRVSYAA